MDVMDFEKDVIVCSGGHSMNSVKIKKEPCDSERTFAEIKLEPDSDDDLLNQTVPSSCSLMECTNPAVASDECAVDMKTEIKEETWWHGSVSSDKFQPHLSSLSQSHIKNREDVESFNKSKASTCKNIKEAALVSASYAWHPIKYGSKDVAHAIGELRQLQESVNKLSENQFDKFGRSVASQLKNIQYRRALLAQSQIQTFLTNVAIEIHSGKH